MKTFAATLLAALALSGAAAAMPVADLHAATAAPMVKAQFVFGDELLPSRAIGLERVGAETAEAAARTYSDFDALIEFGALALAGGALAAIGAALARRETVPVRPAGPVLELARARVPLRRAA